VVKIVEMAPTDAESSQLHPVIEAIAPNTATMALLYALMPVSPSQM